MCKSQKVDRLKELVYRELEERLLAIKAGTDPIFSDPNEDPDICIAELVLVGREQADADILHLYRQIMDVVGCDYDTAILMQVLTNVKIYLKHLES